MTWPPGVRSPATAALSLLLSSACAVSAAAGNDPLRITPVVKAVQGIAASVVNISTEATSLAGPNPFSDGAFNKFLSDFMDFPTPETGDNRKAVQNLGSGVIFKDTGYILTNEHVVLQSSEVSVKLIGDERDYPAHIVGSDPETDLAILKIETKKKLVPAKLGRSSDLLIGETVIAIGNPYGLSNTVTTGVISAVDRSFRMDDNKVYRNLLQTDAAINPGNSGGPLLNVLGELIGINTAIHAKGYGIGFAIPVDRAKAIFDELMTFGEVQEAWVGAGVQDLTQAIIRSLKYPKLEGLIIRGVEKESPAAVANILIGDIIYRISGQVIRSRKDYTDILRNIRVGEPVKVEIFRDGAFVEKVIVAKRYPESYAERIAMDLMGLAVSGGSKTEGVQIAKIRKNSPAHNVGLMPGDAIRQVDSFIIRSGDDFKRAMLKLPLKESAILAVQRRSHVYFATLNFYKGR